jgi:hypothetical protein
MFNFDTRYAFGTPDYAESWSPCQKHSRWVPFAFTKVDEGSIYTVAGANPGYLSITIDSVVRTIIPASTWNADAGNTGTICSVTENLNGHVTAGTNCVRALSNPRVSFVGGFEPPSNRMVIYASTLALIDLEVKSGALILDSMNGVTVTCDANTPTNGAMFATVGVNIYLFDRRLRLAENTVRSPAADSTPGADTETCITAPKTFLNEKSCVVGAKTCTTESYRFVTL